MPPSPARPGAARSADAETGPEIVVLTGAGISAESGLGTFRDVGGLWTQVRLEDVATFDAYVRDPERVLEFYNARRANCRAAAPNAAHRALARLQAERPGRVLIVTQNVDDLHDRAGAEAGADPADLIHMHGELAGALCAVCGRRWAWGEAPMTLRSRCPGCGGHTVRPDVVWFGEFPYRMEEIGEAIAGCRLFVSIGTSGAVHPAAGFAAEARAAGARTLELNLEPSEGAALFHEARHGPATRLVPEWAAEVAGG